VLQLAKNVLNDEFFKNLNAVGFRVIVNDRGTYIFYLDEVFLMASALALG